MKSRVVALGLVVCLSGQLGGSAAWAQARPAPAADAQAQAREAFERGRIHYDNGEFDQASSAFEDAYRLSGRDGLLYNLYLAYRDANQPEKAAEALRSYLAKVKVIENRAQLEARLKALDEGIAQRRATEAAKGEAEAARLQAERERAEQEKAAQAAREEQRKLQAERAPERKWWVVPVAVMGAGGALMAGSLVTGLMANSKANELEDKCVDGNCPPNLESTADSGKTLSIVTDVLLFGGLATAATGGVLLLLKHRERQAKNTPTANLACTHTGCAGNVTVRF